MKTLERSAVPLLAVLGCCLAFALGLAARPAYALTDAVGNEFTVGEDPVSAHVGRDLYWVGQELALGGVTVDGDLLAAGQTVRATDTEVGGSVRGAGQSIRLERAKVAGNVTVAGQKVVFGEGSEAAAVYAAAQKIEFSGHAATVSLTGSRVEINGRVDGDVWVDAKSLVLGPNAAITGALHADVSKEPQVDAAAKVGTLDVTVTPNDDRDDTPAIEEVGRKAAFTAASGAVVALLLALVFPRAVRGAAEVADDRKLPFIVSGAVGIVLSVPVALALCFTVLPLGLGASSVLALVALALLSVPFTAAVAGRAAAPSWPRVLSAALAGALMGAAASVPYLGVIEGVLCSIFTLGYLIQSVWLAILAERAEREGRVPLPAAHAK